MENGEWKIIENTPTRMDFNSQFSIQLVGWRTSNPSPCWRRLGTAELRPALVAKEQGTTEHAEYTER
jgi:hypothetical protein